MKSNNHTNKSISNPRHLTPDTLSQSPNPQSLPSKPLAIIMRTFNSAWVVDQTLEALFSQNFSDFKLYVVDSGSTDETLDIVRKYPCQLHTIPAGSYYPGNVLNAAISKIDSDVVVFLNSDTVLLSPDSLQHLVDAFDNPEVHAAYGRQIPRPEADLWVQHDYSKSFPLGNDSPEWITLSLPIAGLRRKTWEMHPFYDKAWGSEDTEWGSWAKSQGCKIDYVPEAIAMHSHNYTFRQLYGRRFIEGEADVFIYDKVTSLLSMIKAFGKSVTKDSLLYIKHGKVFDVIKNIARRFIYHWGYYKGQNWGNRRTMVNDTNTAVGQMVVLGSYGKGN